MNEENTTMELLIKGGQISVALGASLSQDKEDGVIIGALLGAAISATVRANNEAQKTNVSVYVEEDGNLYEISPSGNKKYIKKIEKPSVKLPQQFKLK